MINVLIADYISYSDRLGKPIGHPSKVITETKNWICDECNCRIAAHHCMQEKLEQIDVFLPTNMFEGEEYCSFSGKMKQLRKSSLNIRAVFREKADYYWFCNVDIFLFFYLFFHRRRVKKTIVTLYQRRFAKKYQNWICEKICKRVFLAVYSIKSIELPKNNSIYVPDYTFSNEKYEKYRINEKKEKALCIGVMNSGKNLESLVDIWDKISVPLEICGHFDDENRFHRLQEAASGNVTINNTVLSDEEYYQKLSTSKFCVMPYDLQDYSEKTSGVLLESAFLDVCPIAPVVLMNNVGVLGIDFEHFNEESIKSESTYMEIINYNKTVVRERYDEQYYKKAICKKLCK